MSHIEVLVDAKEWHYRALNKALNRFGYNISRDQHINIFDGLPTKKKLEILTEKYGLPLKLHPIIEKLKQEYTILEIIDNCRPIFEHQYALSCLKNKGYKIGLASNSIRKTIDLMMEYSGLKEYLDVILSNQDVVKAKPNPEIYFTAIKRLGVRPEECVVFEDNINGITAAKNAGLKVFEVKDVKDINIVNILRFIESVES